MMKIPSGYTGFRRWQEDYGRGEDDGKVPVPDVRIVTSGGRTIPAHSTILASASSVLEFKIDRPQKHRGWERVVRILGVPCEAVSAFVGLLYSRSMKSEAAGEEAMGRHGVHLLVLAHAYRVGWLKRASEAKLVASITSDGVVDMLQLARQCDAPRLYLCCMRVIAKDFEAVQGSEGWRFVQSHDARLELEVMQFLQDSEQKRKRRRRERAELEIYDQLNEAMECLHHICTEGCTDIGPHDGEPPSRSKGPCKRFRTCEGLQQLIRHFAVCGRKLGQQQRGCRHCKRMWQLFRLHANLCDCPADSCKVPLCKQFRMRMTTEEMGDEETWRLLVRKVLAARIALTLANRKRPEEMKTPWKISGAIKDSCLPCREMILIPEF